MLDNHNSQQQVDDCRWAGRSKTIERVATADLPTSRGNFKIAGYRSLISDEEFVVIFTGELDAHVPTLVRIHSQCLTGDVFGSIKCDCGPQLHRAMEMIEAEGRGAIVYQQQEGRGLTWRTVTGETTHAAATSLAEELRHALDDLPHLPKAPVRVVHADEAAQETDDHRAVERACGGQDPTLYRLA